jgi:hypothetical protein
LGHGDTSREYFDSSLSQRPHPCLDPIKTHSITRYRPGTWREDTIAIPAAIQPEETAPAPKLQTTNAFAKVVSDPFQSRAILGSQRTGKSLFAAVCSATIVSKHQTKIFHLNLASFGDEDLRYWRHATLSIAADLSACDEFTAKEKGMSDAPSL